MPPLRRLRLPVPRLARSPFVFWALVAALAVFTASVVAGAVGRTQSLAARYGPLRPMVVAARPVERGAVVAAEDLTVRRVPAGFLTEGMLGSVDDARGRVTVVPLVEGEPVMSAKLAPEGLSAVAALLPPGSRAVAVPTGSSSPALARGDVVDVLATFDGEPALAVAVDAVVVDVRPDSATVAVSPAEAEAVAFALGNGGVTVALTPGPHPGQRNLVASSPSTAAPATRR